MTQTMSRGGWEKCLSQGLFGNQNQTVCHHLAIWTFQQIQSCSLAPLVVTTALRMSKARAGTQGLGMLRSFQLKCFKWNSGSRNRLVSCDFHLPPISLFCFLRQSHIVFAFCLASLTNAEKCEDASFSCHLVFCQGLLLFDPYCLAKIFQLILVISIES